MPVYLRHANLLSAPSASLNSEIPENDVWDFLQDPTLMVDELPQPFRLVNKLVFQLIDIAWETIDDRESEKIAEAARYKPPEYKCGLQTEVILLVLLFTIGNFEKGRRYSRSSSANKANLQMYLIRRAGLKLML